MRRRLLLLAAAAVATASSCSSTSTAPDLGPSTFQVTITAVNGNTKLPTAENPFPANEGVAVDNWSFTIQAVTPTGDPAADFNGYVRLSLVPGTIVGVTGASDAGRNVLVQNGKATGVVQVTAEYGPTRLWVEDLGYVPAPKGKVPACSNGIDDNHNGLIDFPSDPGCYYADDDSEDGGSYAAGVSPAIQYALPRISDVRGGARTPYPNEAIEIATSDPEYLVVTRVSSTGFFVTDVGSGEVANGYNSLYAYNFSTPGDMRVCDRITYLGGTANDFYGFTQLSFPSYRNTYVVQVDAGVPDGGVPGCRVPEPTVLAASFFTGDKNTTSQQLYKFESGLVRLEGFTIAANFGSNLAKNNLFGPNQSNCDFNGDGQIDYTAIAPNCPAGLCEGDCATLCDSLPDCTEWTSYSARNEYKVSLGTAATMIQIDTSTVATFDPVANAGKTIPFVSGSLTEFSGGSLNWTVEVRCPDDLVCPAEMGCTTQQPIPSSSACVRPRTSSDNDQGSN